MTTPVSVSIPHQLGRAEARRRIEHGFAKIIDIVPGGTGTCDERWDGDRLTFRVTAMGQTVSGVVDVLEAVVLVEMELPGVLGLLAGKLKDHVQNAGRRLLARN